MLHEVLPEHERTRLEHFETEMLLSGEEMAAVQERGFHGDCYFRPTAEHKSQDLPHVSG